jgi:hypothetical protein
MTKPPKAPRGKPGRPRVVDDNVVKIYPHLSQRSLNNRQYAITVIGRLGMLDKSSGPTRIKVPPRYRYLLPTDDLRRRARWDVLARLGRLPHQEDEFLLKTFADRVCQLEPSAKEAVRLILKWLDSYGWQIQLYREKIIGRRLSADQIGADMRRIARDVSHDKFPDPASKEERRERWRNFREFRAEFAAITRAPAPKGQRRR